MYLLGLTWLYMAKLGLSKGLAKAEGLEEAAKREIESLISLNLRDLISAH